jgi:sugar phosphate permease
MPEVEAAPIAGKTVDRRPGARLWGLDGHSRVMLLLCAMFALMYLDRINISAAASSLRGEFGLSNTQLGIAFSAFSWAYLGSVLFGGLGVRRYGARRTLVCCAVLVGLATLATGFVQGLAGLFVVRLLVGAGEGPAFPAATQAMRDWYPPDRFGYIQGVTHSASRLGGALAPPLVAWITVLVGWRVSFVVCGGLAVLWAVGWWRYFRDDPRRHKDVQPDRLRGIEPALPARTGRVPLRALTRRMAIVTFVMFTYGWSYWVFLSWLPLYFANRYGTDLRSSALLASAPLLAGVVGNSLGGIISDALLRRTGRHRLARCGVVFVSLLGAALFLIPSMITSELVVVVPLLALSMLFLEMTIAPMYAVPMDMSREYSGIGSAFIIMGVGIAGIVSPIVFGWLIDLTGNWNVPFLTAVLILIAGAVGVVFVRPDRPFAPPA